MSPSHEKQPIKYREYYFPEGDIFVTVDNNIFRIDKHYLTRDSTRLRSMILDPINPGRDHPGSSETKPFPLDEHDPEVTSEGFISLLWVFYNPDFTFDATVEKWKHILHLAHHWGIARVVKLCIRELGKLEMDPVEKIEFYENLKLNRNLLQTSFRDLVIRPQPLSIDEGARLGNEISIRVYQAREHARDPDQSIKLQESDVSKELIEETFGLQGSTPPSATASPQRENPTTDDRADKGGKRNKNRQRSSSSNIFGL